MAAILCFCVWLEQPPSGGCVLKPDREAAQILANVAATFGWLCVETAVRMMSFRNSEPAATFGWLCVETLQRVAEITDDKEQPPSGGCVLKQLLSLDLTQI